LNGRASEPSHPTSSPQTSDSFFLLASWELDGACLSRPPVNSGITTAEGVPTGQASPPFTSQRYLTCTARSRPAGRHSQAVTCGATTLEESPSKTARPLCRTAGPPPRQPTNDTGCGARAGATHHGRRPRSLSVSRRAEARGLGHESVYLYQPPAPACHMGSFTNRPGRHHRTATRRPAAAAVLGALTVTNRFPCVLRRHPSEQKTKRGHNADERRRGQGKRIRAWPAKERPAGVRRRRELRLHNRDEIDGGASDLVLYE
jgi:hypothetical protein